MLIKVNRQVLKVIELNGVFNFMLAALLIALGSFALPMNSIQGKIADRSDENYVLDLLDHMPSPLWDGEHPVNVSLLEKKCDLVSKCATKVIDAGVRKYMAKYSPLRFTTNEGLHHAAVCYMLSRYLFKVDAAYVPPEYTRTDIFFGCRENWPSGMQTWPWMPDGKGGLHFKAWMQAGIMGDIPIDPLGDFISVEKYPRRTLTSFAPSIEVSGKGGDVITSIHFRSVLSRHQIPFNKSIGNPTYVYAGPSHHS